MLVNTPFNVPEIQTLIAQHLDKEDYPKYGLISKAWHEVLRPEHWESVVFDAKGPFFHDWQAEHLVDHIRTLEYHAGAFQGSMPTDGYNRLTTLRIIHVHNRARREPEIWPPLVQLVQRMAGGPLVAVELVSTNAIPEFWEALSHYHLKSLSLENSMSPSPRDTTAMACFWKICRSVETLNLRFSNGYACPLIRSRLFQLKHLDLEHSNIKSSNPDWSQARPWLCSPNLESLRFVHSKTSASGSELKAMAADIRAAMVAAAKGLNHYEQDKDHADEGLEQYRGLIPGKKLHSIEVGPGFGGASNEDLCLLISNCDVLRKWCVPHSSLSALGFDSLLRHCDTLVELDLRTEMAMSPVVLALMCHCPHLEALSVDEMDISIFLRNLTWACTGLKRLRMSFDGHILEERGLVAEESPQIFQKLSNLPKLEYLDVLPRSGSVSRQWGARPLFAIEHGLHYLENLKGLREIHGDLTLFTSASARWLVESWPKLEQVGFYVPGASVSELPAAVKDILHAQGVSMTSRMW
ncbi:hypothetical protein BGZ74_005811 [Mortierella antarctica]|nr:hypothetical protein BGZ74_005811 [Mortierella antarctica]